MLPILTGAISLRSADISTLKILGYIRFVFTLGTKSLPVESLVLPRLGAEAMLIDDSIMKEVFGAKLDWAAERLSFSDSNITIPAIHTRESIRSNNCSVITQNFDTAIPVLVRNEYIVPSHGTFIHVFSRLRPQKDTSSIGLFFRYPRKNGVNILSLKKKIPFRDKLRKFITTRIGLIQDHRKYLIHILRAWSLMVFR